MNRIIQILTFILHTTICFSQNDTIYLHQNYILLGDEKLNLVNNEGKKTGKWVEYKMGYPMELVPQSDYHPSRPNEIYEIAYEDEFRPLKEGEYEMITIFQSERIDSFRNEKIHRQKYKVIHSKIPSELYLIQGIGNYKNNLKHGAWKYFYQTGELKKEITYEKGIPKGDFDINRENGTLMIRFVKINDSVWEVSKYNENEVIFETIRDKIEKFNGLY
jgi:antitoxin component YwqK of YwqJK toxin-antitoxin module